MGDDRVLITGIRVHHLRRELDPPFYPAWDPHPRRHFDATVVFVDTDEGITGVGSGDSMAGLAGCESLFIGTDPTRISEQVRRIETINFHGGRCWPLEAAFWDILGKAAGLPVARLLGGARDTVPAYASTAELRTPSERAESAVAIREAGFRAMKIRVDPHHWRAGLESVAAARTAVGDDLEIMVDLNQGWRMAGDTRRAPDYAAVRDLSRRLHDLDVFWIEEPLPYSDAAGMQRLRRETGVRVASGEMNDSLDQLLGYLDRDAVDIYQMDVVLALGISRARTFAELAAHRNRRYTPHSWTNGIGMLANLHVCAGVGGGPYFEFPFDPPGWDPGRRDFMLTEPLDIDSEGRLHVPDSPGLGIRLDEEACRRWIL